MAWGRSPSPEGSRLQPAASVCRLGEVCLVSSAKRVPPGSRARVTLPPGTFAVLQTPSGCDAGQ